MQGACVLGCPFFSPHSCLCLSPGALNARGLCPWLCCRHAVHVGQPPSALRSLLWPPAGRLPVRPLRATTCAATSGGRMRGCPEAWPLPQCLALAALLSQVSLPDFHSICMSTFAFASLFCPCLQSAQTHRAACSVVLCSSL